MSGCCLFDKAGARATMQLRMQFSFVGEVVMLCMSLSCADKSGSRDVGENHKLWFRFLARMQGFEGLNVIRHFVPQH